MPIDNLRLVLIDSQTIALDLHYQLSVGNSVGHNYIRTAYSTGAAEIVEQNLVMVPDAADNEQIIMTAEWVSPPMMLGVEYRTTKRWNNRPVYTKVINFGALPDTSSKSVAHNIDDFYCAVGVYGTAGTSSFIGLKGLASFGANATNLVVETSGNLSSVNANIVVEYIKTTD